MRQLVLFWMNENVNVELHVDKFHVLNYFLYYIYFYTYFCTCIMSGKNGNPKIYFHILHIYFDPKGIRKLQSWCEQCWVYSFLTWSQKFVTFLVFKAFSRAESLVESGNDSFAIAILLNSRNVLNIILFKISLFLTVFKLANID